MRSRSWVVLCLVGLLAVSAPALAQLTTGDIVGTVTDESGAVMPGVTVTLKGKFAAGIFTSITTGRGFYFFNRLHPGFYDLSFTRDGFRPLTRTGVRVTLGATTTENVTLSVGAMTDEVTVIGDSMVVDAKSVGMSNTYDNEAVVNLPLRRLSIYDLMYAAPGITSAGEYRPLMAMGSESDANAYKLDGVSITQRSNGDANLTPNTDIIDEVEVIALGAPAEYGHVPGGVFSVITRQGSNRFHGDVNLYIQTDGLTGRNTTDEYDNGHPYHRDKFHDFTAQLGGPVVKDKLWFFASYQNWLSAESRAGVDEDYASEYRNWTMFGKLNWQINPSHRIVASFHQDNYEYPSVGYPFRSPSTRALSYGKTPTPSVAYTGVLTDRTMVEVRYGGFYWKAHFSPLDPDQPKGQPVYHNYAHGGDCSEGPCLRTGNPALWYDTDDTSTNINASLSHYSDDFLGGSHDFKFGVQYLRAGTPNAIIGYEDWFTLYQGDYGEEYVWGYDSTPFSYSGLANNWSVFLDDTFRVNDRLTLRLGLRYDHDWASVNALPLVDSAGNPTGEIFSPAVDNLYSFDNLSPRLGFTYTLTEDGKTLLRGHYGRYHRGIVTADFAGNPGNIATSDVATYVGYYDPAGFHAETLVGDGRGFNIGGAGNVAIDPGISSTYTDQLSLGFERELAANLGLALTYSYKRGNDFPAWRDATGKYEQFQYTEPITGIPLTLNRLISDPEERQFLLGNPDFMDTKVHAFAVALNKRMSNHWQLVSSLTLLRSTGMLASGKTSNAWGNQSGSVAWADFGKSPNDFVNLGGRLVGDMPVTFKTQLVGELPAGFLVGANYTYASGGPWARSERIDTGPLGREGILLEKMDGSRRWDNRSVLDLRLRWSVGLSGRAGLALFADGFNVFNSDAGQCVRTTRVSSERFAKPGCIVLPRRVQLGASLRF